MAAITWRNVDAPHLGEVNRGMYLGGVGINQGFDKLGEVLKQREATDTANWEQQKANNTNTLFNKLAGYNSPEEYQAALSSGALQQEAAGYGAQVDQAAFRQALDRRMGDLQQRAVQGVNYNNTMTDSTQAPVLDQIKAYRVAGKNAEADALEASNPDLRHKGERAVLVDALAKSKVTEERATKEFGWKEEKAPLERGLLQSQINENNRKTAEVSGDAGVRGLFSGMLKQYQTEQNGYRASTAKLATDLKIPLDKAGVPVFTGTTPEQQAEYELKAKDIPAAPSSSAYKAQFIQSLIGAGTDPKKILEAEKQFDALVGNGAEISSSDQEALKAGTERIDTKNREIRANNIFYSAPGGNLADKETVLIEVNKIKDGDFWTKNPIKKELSGWMDGSFPLKKADGTTENIAVPPKLMKAALAYGMEKDTTLFNNTEGRVQEFLQDKLTSPEYAASRKEADDLVRGDGAIAKKTLVDTARNVPGILSAPSEVDARLQASIDAAAKRSGTPPVQEKKSPEIVQPVSTSSPFTGATTPSLPMNSKEAQSATTPVPVTSSFSLGSPGKETKPFQLAPDIKWESPSVLVQAKPTIASLSQSTAPQSAVLTYAEDGDTGKLQLKDGSSVNCRLEGINAPETAHKDKPGQPYGDASKNWLKDKVLNKEVTLRITKPVMFPDGPATKGNNYNRALCQISIEGEDINLSSVKEGAAWVFDHFVRGTARGNVLREAQSQAQANKRGLWAEPNPINPSDFLKSIEKK